MRVFSVVVALLAVVGVAQAQAPSGQPTGTLAQVMRGIFFPNSNIIFDVQARDPDAPPESADGDSTTARFSSIYTGWPVVENAAIALAEGANLIAVVGRKCENGRQVPLADPDFVQYAREMEAAGRSVLEVARTKDREAMVEATNTLAGACENCHSVYRRYPEENRCQKPAPPAAQ